MVSLLRPTARARNDRANTPRASESAKGRRASPGGVRDRLRDDDGLAEPAAVAVGRSRVNRRAGAQLDRGLFQARALLGEDDGACRDDDQRELHNCRAETYHMHRILPFVQFCSRQFQRTRKQLSVCLNHDT